MTQVTLNKKKNLILEKIYSFDIEPGPSFKLTNYHIYSKTFFDCIERFVKFI